MRRHAVRLMLFILLTNIALAYCPPERDKIDSVQNPRLCLWIQAISSCGGGIEITNHCPGEFYFYHSNGTLDDQFVLVNAENYWIKSKEYDQLTDETGKRYSGSRSPGLEGSWCFECKDKSQIFPSCEEIVTKELFVNDINLCDQDRPEGAMRYWNIKIFDKERNRDIIVEGHTYREDEKKRLAAFYFIIDYGWILCFSGSLIMFFLKYKLKKNISIGWPALLIGFGTYLFLAWLFFKVMAVIDPL